MNVQELIDILRDQPPEAEVELAIVAPIADDSDDISVDRFDIAGVMPWDNAGEIDEGPSVWLLSSVNDDDVEVFLDALEGDAD